MTTTVWQVTLAFSDATAAFDVMNYDGKKYNAEEIHQISLATLHKEFATIVDTKTVLTN